MTIRVNDFQSSVAWYQEKLGLEPVGLHEDPFCFMKFPQGTAMIALLEESRSGGDEGITPAIKVADLGVTVDELKGRGVEFTEEIEDDEEGYRIISFKDPDGNRLTLWSD